MQNFGAYKNVEKLSKPPDKRAKLIVVLALAPGRDFFSAATPVFPLPQRGALLDQKTLHGCATNKFMVFICQLVFSYNNSNGTYLEVPYWPYS